MSATAGRITKTKGPKFVPRRPNASKPRSTKEQSSTVTPKQVSVSLPQLERREEEDEDFSPPRVSTTSRTALGGQPDAADQSPASAFGPTDPSLRFSQSSPSSSPARSQPQSSFGFGPQDPTLTQATSVGPSSQLPDSSLFPRDSSSPDTPSLSLPQVKATTADVDRPVPSKSNSREVKGKGKGRAVDLDRGKGAVKASKGGKKAGSGLAERNSRRWNESDHEEEEERGQPRIRDGGSDAANSAPKTKGRIPRITTRPQKRGASVEAGNAESSEDEWDSMKPKKRRARKAAVKRGKLDALLFDDDDDDDDDGDGGDRGGGWVAAGGYLDDSDSSAEPGPRRRRYKKNDPKNSMKPNRAPDEPLPAVDPSQTTMSQLAAANPGFEIGRPSERTLFFEKQKVDRRTAMKLKRQKMKRKAAGLDTGSDAEGGNGDGDNRGNGKGKEKGDSYRRDASPHVMDPAVAIALMGGIIQEGDDDADEDSDNAGLQELATEEGVPKEGKEDGDEGAEDDEDDYGDLAETTLAPQMRIVNGQLVLDEESLQIDRSVPTDTGPREVIEESAQDRFVNSRSFSKKPGKAKKWSIEDTERFYDALSQFGTDFELISALFPGRSRREIKLKWTKEDKINSKKITAALMQRKKIDLESYAKFSGQDLTGPTPADPMDEINERRAKLEAEGHLVGASGQRRGPEGSHGVDKKLKGKRKRGAVDEAGAALFDEEAIEREREAAERRRLEAEQEEEERQAMIDALENADDE